MKKWCARLLIAAIIVGIMARPTTIYAEESEYYIRINRKQNCVTVYTRDEKGKYSVPVRAFACSTGANNATPKGVFKLGQKYRWRELDGHVYGQYSTRITGRVLFHSVYYHTTDPSTLYYGAYNQLGSAVSHGCVRLCVADAKWIFDNCDSGTLVEIYDGNDPGPLGKPDTVRISAANANRGWDPTDPHPDNPWILNAPKITGAGNKTIERGSDEAKLLKGVKAVDFAGNTLEVTLSGKCDLGKVGKYKLTYKAVDALGKTGKTQVTITVRDTKAPTVSLAAEELELTDDSGDFFDIDDMKTYLKQFVTAKDSGETLPDRKVHIIAGNLWNAWERRQYGSYELRVYAKDAAGNQSKVKILTVHYIEPEPETQDDTAETDSE